MTKWHEAEQSLRTRLAELTGRVERIDADLREPLAADSEEQATELADDEALTAIEAAGRAELRQIHNALYRIADGSFGICQSCGRHIAPARLAALPTAALCKSCAEIGER